MSFATEQRLLKNMLRIRSFEERCAELYSEEKIRGFLHLYIGQEAAASGVIDHLKPEDNLIATYREHAHALLKGISAKQIMAEMFGKKTGCSHGRGGSMHLFSVEKRFFGGNAIVASGLPHAVGLALSAKILKQDRLTVCFLGDGAMAEGLFHESMNLAALWQLPVLFCCENNLYAMGTALHRYQSQIDLTKKASAYNIQSESVDGMDVMEVWLASGAAIDFVRRNAKPFFLELKTYRFKAHSMFDPDLYRSKEEIKSWKLRCPIEGLKKKLIQKNILNEGQLNQILNEINNDINTEISEAISFAESSEYESASEIFKDVYHLDVNSGA